jgi:very-short-patch-repair endonuclease
VKCQYRYCNKEIKFGRPDRKFCNESCKGKENQVVKELKSLIIKVEKTKKFIERCKKIHNNKYKYDLVVYENCRKKINIICPIHGIFQQTASNHLYNKYGCDMCSRDIHKLSFLSEKRLEKLKKIHNNKYYYTDLSVNKGFINIICPSHGSFKQYLYFHEYGHGCSECNSSSRGENFIKEYLDRKNIKYKRNFIFKECKNERGLRFDFYLYENNIIIEYDGEHHFMENKYFGIGNLNYIQKNDEIKNKFCLNNNISIIRIPYFEFNRIEEILDRCL